MSATLKSAKSIPAEVSSGKPPARGWMRLSPPWLISILITLILALGQWRYQIIGGSGLGGVDRLVVALGLAMALEALLGLVVRGRVPALQSAYVSGISATLLTKPASGVLWPVAFVAMLAIASKYALTYRGRHLWNPTNFGVCCMLLIAPQSMSILGSDLGNELGTNLVIWSVGLVIAWRAKILHVTLTYLIAFVVFALLRSSITHVPPLIEIAPVTGPMYQLFLFFMVTDPRTTVSTRQGRILVAILIAAMECAIRLGNDYDMQSVALFRSAPPMFALTIVGPAAMLLDLWRTAAPGGTATTSAAVPPVSLR
ncbi:MAG: RnfABCDGE type electron transport complex subunit D [Planctomycetota bacterium]